MRPSFMGQDSMCDRTSASRRGFSLVELLVVIGIIGVLMGLALPAVHRVRESSRRAACGNNLRQCTLGTLAYETARRTFPPGCDVRPAGHALPEGTQHAWSTFILPYIEEGSLAARIDLKKLWDAPNGNDVASDTTVPAYICPSAVIPSVGKSDYGGVSGSWIMMEGVPFFGPAGLSNGILISVDGNSGTADPVRASGITDGLSDTVLVAESVDRCDPAEAGDVRTKLGRWAWVNCFVQAAGFVNTRGSDIQSNHPQGAQVAFADGHVVFFSDSTDPKVLSAICTRNGGEAEASTAGL